MNQPGWASGNLDASSLHPHSQEDADSSPSLQSGVCLLSVPCPHPGKGRQDCSHGCLSHLLPNFSTSSHAPSGQFYKLQLETHFESTDRTILLLLHTHHSQNEIGKANKAERPPDLTPRTSALLQPPSAHQAMPGGGLHKPFFLAWLPQPYSAPSASALPLEALPDHCPSPQSKARVFLGSHRPPPTTFSPSKHLSACLPPVSHPEGEPPESRAHILFLDLHPTRGT